MPTNATKEIRLGAITQELEGTFRIRDGEIGTLDTASVDYYAPFPGFTGALAGAGFTKNQIAPAVGYFFTQAIEATREGCDSCIATITMVGMSGGFNERRRRSISAYGKIVSVGPIEKVVLVVQRNEKGTDASSGNETKAIRRIPKVDESDEGKIVYKQISVGSGYGERWNINVPDISVTDTYFAQTAPSTLGVGAVGSPPTPPPTPPFIWGGYNEPLRFNHPNGWVLDDRQVVEVIPGKLYQVTDTHNHYQPSVPD